MMRKKGGMELSINAIVILIIAMVVLGIAILFIRGLFAKSGEKLTTAISSQELKNPATPDTPLVADREVLISRSNPTKTIVLSVFNSATQQAKEVQVGMSDCVSSEGELGSANYSLRTVKQDIAQNTYVGYQAIVSFDPTLLTQGDTIVCRLVANTTTANIWDTKPSTTVTFTVTS
ncbi:hypothetical protein KY308_00105 [Candidatus Woesearchaeota archaeon]|nr:hypothetical protein [Candidatus Woesearchaeota archaeon]